MSRPPLEEGFKFWRDEVDTLEQPERIVPYIPIIGLVGVYAACTTSRSKLTSYHFRREVLANVDAFEGLRKSVPSLSADELDDTYELPIDRTPPEVGTPLQFQHEHASIMDGLPENVTSIPWNEWFIARNLGFACHDQSLNLEPLRVIDQGRQALANSYPLTARYVEELA